jgi:hypothetical protein
MTSSTPGFYGRLARWVLAHRTATLVFVAVCTVLAAIATTFLKVDSDILALMPQDEPSTQALERLDKQEGGINFLTIAVDADDTATRDAFMKDLAGRLEAMPDQVDYVLYELDPNIAFRLGLLQVPLTDLTVMRDRLRAALALGPAATNPFIAARLLDLGPMTAKLQDADKPLGLGAGDHMGRMLIRPKGSAHDLPFARVFMANVQAAIDAADPAGHGVTIPWIGGAYRHNVEDYEGIVRDIGWITLASFVMVLLIIAAAFRTPRAVAIIFIPLVLSNLWTLGVAGATVGSLNTFTSFVNAVLIGLGVEFGVHLLARFRELRDAGHGVEDSIVRAWDLVGSACTSAAFTSSAGFAALLAAHFAGFRQLGWLLSLGLMFCLIAEVVCMPLLIVWLEKSTTFVGARTHHRHRRKRPASYRLAPMALLVIGSFTLVSGLLIRQIKFEYDLSELRRSGLAYEDLSDSEKALARESYSPLVVSYPTAEDLDTAYARISKRMADGHFPEVTTALSIRTVIPTDQEARIALLREIAAMGQDPNAVFLPPQVRSNLARVQSTPLEPVTPADLPKALQHVLGANNGQHRLLLLPAGNMWDMRQAADLARAVERELPGQEVAGEYLTLGVLYDLMQHDAPIIGAIAFGLVVFFTLLDLRKLRPTAGAIAVLLAGVAWWGALLVSANIKISIVNFVGIPIVLGIGIDVMIHLIHRMHQEGPGRIQKALATTGWASALGTSTTVVAFAALSLASSQGIRSLGLLVLLGEMSVTIAGFVLVPLGFATTWRLQGRHPTAHPVEDTNPGAVP